MIKRLSILLSVAVMLLALCCGCTAAPGGQSSDPTGKNNYNFDYRPGSMATRGGDVMLETDDNIYFLLKGYLYFSDKDGKDFMPLCNRPDCDHKDMDCNAYSDAVDYTLYGDRIWFVDGFYAGNYFLDGRYVEDLNSIDFDNVRARLHFPESIQKPALWRMNIDGTAHEKIWELPIPETDFTPTLNSWFSCFTGKYLLIGCKQFGADNRTSFDMYTLDIDTLEYKPVTCGRSEHALDSWPVLMAGRGDLLYCCIGDDSFFDGVDESKRIRTLCELDCSTGELLEIGRMEAEQLNPEFSFYITDNELWYITSSNEPDTELRLYKMNLESGEVSRELTTRASEMTWCEIDWQNGLLFTDQRRRDAVNDKGLYFCGLDGSIVDSHVYSDEELAEINSIMMFFQTENYIFAIGPDKSGAYSAQNGVPEWYIDKADIGTGNLMWKRWAPEG